MLLLLVSTFTKGGVLVGKETRVQLQLLLAILILSELELLLKVHHLVHEDLLG